MTTEAMYPADDPRQLLSSARELTQRVRRAQRATWFPLLVFAAVTFAAIPFARYGPLIATCRSVHVGGHTNRACLGGAGLYWPIAQVLAYAAIAVFYIRRSQAHGIGTRVRPYAIAGIIIAVLGVGVTLWALYDPSIIGLGPQPSLVIRLASPAATIGLALLVLAWAERNGALLALVLGYLAIVLIPIDFGWTLNTPGHLSIWGFLPSLVIHGSVLLLGGIGFAWAQRPGRQPGGRDAT